MVAATLSPGESLAELVLGGVGLITAIWVISSPFPTFRNIWRTQQVGGTNPYSYLAVLFNSAMWVVFGIPAIKLLVHGHHHTFAQWLGVPLMAANAFGIIAELFYVAVFIRFALDNRCLPVITLVAVFLVSVTVLLLLLLTHWSRTFVGYFAMFSGAAMYVIPVYNTYVALNTNDLALVSAFQASASFANGLVWTAYSCIDHVRGFIFLIAWAYLKCKAARQAEAARRAAEQERAEAERGAAAENLESGAGGGRGGAELPRAAAQDLESGAGGGRGGAELPRAAAQDLELGAGGGGNGAERRAGGGDVQMALQGAAVAGGGGAVQGVGGAGADENVLAADVVENQLQGQKEDGDNNDAGAQGKEQGGSGSNDGDNLGDGGTAVENTGEGN